MNTADINKPVALWTGSDRIGEEVLQSLTIILRSGGCSWNRCRMCQYRHERISNISEDELTLAMETQLQALETGLAEQDAPLVKIYTSGSFFDPKEVPLAVREKIAEVCRGRTLVVECRADYISEEAMADFKHLLQNEKGEGGLIVAIGLETSSDYIREKCIDKGVTFADYVEAAKAIHHAGGLVKTYLLHKPPYLTEKEAYDDMISSITDILPHTDLISMNPCTVQKQTIVQQLWKKGSYRPPYLWSVVMILEQAPVHITCDPLGGGYQRGPHNCGTCDRLILPAIRDYNISADKELLRSVLEIDCSCKEEWEFVMKEERPYNLPLTR